MDLWIIATLAAAFFQTLRFMLHKVLSMGTLSTAGSTFARFAYAAPMAVLATLAYLALGPVGFPTLGPQFWAYALTGGLAQILATVCVIALFRSRNFAVGITFKKTETIQTALLALVVLGEVVSPLGWVAILIGLTGVLVLAGNPAIEGGFWQGLFSRAVGLGLMSGFFFAISGVTYRGATLQVGAEDPLLRAAITLSFVALSQCLAMALWLRWREPGQITAVWGARRAAVWLGLTSMLGSLGWFTAFTLQNAAYVQALGQIELIFSLLASTLFFREKITPRELLGIGLLTASILVLIFVI